MADQVRAIQNSGTPKLKFNVNDSKDQSMQGMINFIMGPNPQNRLENIKSMLNKFYKDLKSKINGVSMNINDNCVKTAESITSKVQRIMAEKPNASLVNIFQEISERDLIRCRIRLTNEEEY